jgi:hypothetical protein
MGSQPFAPPCRWTPGLATLESLPRVRKLCLMYLQPIKLFLAYSFFAEFRLILIKLIPCDLLTANNRLFGTLTYDATRCKRVFGLCTSPSSLISFSSTVIFELRNNGSECQLGRNYNILLPANHSKIGPAHAPLRCRNVTRKFISRVMSLSLGFPAASFFG